MKTISFLQRAWRRISHFPLTYFLLFPLYVLTEQLFRFPAPVKMRRTFGPPLQWNLGISIIIPHRGPVGMLAECLDALNKALDKINEPYEIVVVFNDVNQKECEDLCQAYGFINPLYHDEPLGFTSSVGLGLTATNHDGIYLLNNDMILEEGALMEVMRWRSPRTFAVASQIFLPEGRKREETGWTAMDFHLGIPYPRHLNPTDPEVTRGTVYAGAGSSLFNRQLLIDLVGKTAPYDPFYWEDVDWSVRAWRMGYNVLFCPRSIAHHKHRATVQRYYSERTVNHVFERNRINFFLRNPSNYPGLRTAIRSFLIQGSAILADLSGPGNLIGTFKSRFDAWRAPWWKMDISNLHRHILTLPPDDQKTSKKKLLIVTPFCIYPPRHGGAVRTYKLIEKLSSEFSVSLVSDEADLYDPKRWQPLSDLVTSIILVGNRSGEDQTHEPIRIQRIRSHSHQTLHDAVLRELTYDKPDAVLVEHMELGGLASLRKNTDIPFVLDLHDVLLSPDTPSHSEADAYEKSLIECFDAVVVCSDEDRELLPQDEVTVVPNGVDIEGEKDLAYVPSRGNKNILFVGPFRCPSNRDGILQFLRNVWPEVQNAVEDVTLTIIGGEEARTSTQLLPYSRQKNITVLESVLDVRPLLDGSAVTINPHRNLRGSSLKLIESLAAGRVCVSTIDGARGFTRSGFASLLTVSNITDFEKPLIRLLTDENYRLSIEFPEVNKLLPYSWNQSSRLLKETLISKMPG